MTFFRALVFALLATAWCCIFYRQLCVGSQRLGAAIYAGKTKVQITCRRGHAARCSWKSQEQKALVIGKLIEALEEFQAAQARIQEDTR
jgi:hypothetical protein